MTMRKSHFEALTRALRDTRPPAETEWSDTEENLKGCRAQWQEDVIKIADVCAVSNVSFRRGQFYDACGYAAAYGRA